MMSKLLLPGAALLGLAGAADVGLIYAANRGKTDTGWVEPGNAPVHVSWSC